MQYLTFGQYTSIGGTLDETAFNRQIERVSNIIASETQKRIDKMAEIPSAVKSLCRDLCEYFAENSTLKGNNVASRSQSVGNVSESVTYSNAKSKEEINEEAYQLIEDYLSAVEDDNGTPLLYRGGSR